MNIFDLFGQPVPIYVTVAVIADLCIRIIALGVIPHNRRPSASLGWLIAIFFIPIVGVLLFLLIGRSNLPPRRSELQHQTSDLVPKTDPAEESEKRSVELPDWAQEAIRLNLSNGAMPLVSGNSALVFDDDQESLNSMTEAVRGAKSSVHFQFYIVALDSTTEPLISAMADAHRRGVSVRVLIDHLGSLTFPGYKEVIHRLTEVGIPWRRMLPVRPWRGEYQRPDLRNHRKILVVDGTVAFTGSQNIIDSSYNKKKNLREHLQWIDLVLRLEGPVVEQLDAVFRTDWCSETGETPQSLAGQPASALGETPNPPADTFLAQLLPSGPGYDDQPNLRLFNHLFYSAKRSIAIVSPYFVPDASMFYAITTAVQCGVKVRLYVGETADHAVTHHAQRSYYELLLKAGVEIFLYRAPYVLHSKILIIDDDVAVVASSNMDIRSFVLNLEVNLMVYDRKFVQRMRDIEQKYRDASHQLLLEDWLRRPWPKKYLDNACRLTSNLQ